MSDRTPLRRVRSRERPDPERALVLALRCALPPAGLLPAALAALAVSFAGVGLGPLLAAPLAALTVVLNVACWRRVVVRWRALPPPGDEDGDGPGRSWDDDPPSGPDDGSGGLSFDWPAFEREFWAYVAELERLREREVVSV